MSILIEKPGILTTLQDLGRNNFQRFGINPNGVMDRLAVRLINTLLGNDENSAVLEMHFPAAEIFFEEAAEFVLGGADFAARTNDQTVDNWRIYQAEKGSTLKFTDKSFGNRAYLALRNGFETESWLGSASTNLKAKIGGLEGRKLFKGDRVFFGSRFQVPGSRSQVLSLKSEDQINRSTFKISNSLIPYYAKFPTVRVVAGAEFERLTAESRENLLNENYSITQNSDRMGYRLHGAPLRLENPKEIVSSAVNFGTIQLLPDGQMIVLMADHQTSGGYPRLANVVSIDLPLLAQLGTNDKAAFHLITVEAAENLLLKFENDLNLLKIGVKFR